MEKQPAVHIVSRFNQLMTAFIQPEPWQNVDPNSNTKLSAVNHKFDKEYKRKEVRRHDLKALADTHQLMIKFICISGKLPHLLAQSQTTFIRLSALYASEPVASG